MANMELTTAPRAASAYRVSIPFTISHPLHEQVARMAGRVGITPAQAFITTFVVLLNNTTEKNTLSVYVQQPPQVAEKCVPMYLRGETSFRALAHEVANNLQNAATFPIFVRFDDNARGLELELQQFSEVLQPYVGYNPRRFERDEILHLIENYRSLLKRFVALPDLPLKL